MDKTGLTACTNKYLNTEQKYLCVSRPRRFGKSMALRMLAAYYGSGNDSRELFAGREIGSDSSYEEHLNRYDVRQSRDRQYTRALEGDSGEVLLVGGEL